MLHINEDKIQDLLNTTSQPSSDELTKILIKAKALNRLSLSETAQLLSITDHEQIQQIFAAAAYVKDTIYGKRIVLFAPLYISNVCENNCLYCAFQADNKLIERKVLSPSDIKKQTEWLLQRGHMRILMVAGESAPGNLSNIDFYVQSVKAIYEASYKNYKIKRVNVNAAPLSVEEFKKLKAAGIGTYQLFQETYHSKTYQDVHPRGPKSDPDNRLNAIDRAFAAGIDDVGVGVLYGLYDHRFETLALLQHIEYLEKTHGIGPHTISVPRIEPALGSALSNKVPYEISDLEFKKVVAILRLAVPYTGLILSTRETAQLRDELVTLGISQISAESNTAPGGYSTEDKNAQFITADHRSLDQIVKSSLEKGLIPSFCAACYRKERTGEVFMDLAKPGLIKKQCTLNALITLKEYLDDFGSAEVKTLGYPLIEKEKNKLNPAEKDQLEKIYQLIAAGERDKYI